MKIVHAFSKELLRSRHATSGGIQQASLEEALEVANCGPIYNMLGMRHANICLRLRPNYERRRLRSGRAQPLEQKNIETTIGLGLG